MILELKNIYKTYEQGKMDVPVLKNISMNIEKGDYVAIMGPSGSGKTTLMNLIGCLDYPSSGEYLLDGENVLLGNDSKLSDVRLNSIGFVFQSFHLLPRQTALENVALPLLYAGIKKKERLEIAQHALGRVGLADRTDFKPTQLSGGQCQRVAIARAIVNNPKILLADEPTGALDTVSGEQIMELFESLNRDGVTVIMITHEREIARHANTIIYIRDGRLVDKSGRFLQSDPDPMGSSGYEAKALPEYNQNLPEVPVENPRQAPVKPEGTTADSLPPAAPPNPKIQERSLHTAKRPHASRFTLESGLTDAVPVQAAPDKPEKHESAAHSAIQNRRRTLALENTAVDSSAVPKSKAPVQEHTVHTAAPNQASTPDPKPEQGIPVTQSYDKTDERERLLRMDVDALLSRVIGGAIQAEPEKPASAAAASAPLTKKAAVPKPAEELKPAIKPAAPKPAPASKPASSGDAWLPPRGNTAPVFTFEKNGQFNRPIKIDLKNADMGSSPWLFSTGGE